MEVQHCRCQRRAAGRSDDHHYPTLLRNTNERGEPDGKRANSAISLGTVTGDATGRSGCARGTRRQGGTGVLGWGVVEVGTWLPGRAVGSVGQPRCGEGEDCAACASCGKIAVRLSLAHPLDPHAAQSARLSALPCVPVPPPALRCASPPDPLGRRP